MQTLHRLYQLHWQVKNWIPYKLSCLDPCPMRTSTGLWPSLMRWEKRQFHLKKKNSSSEISSHFNQYWCIIIRMAPELWTLKNSVRWWWPHSTSRKEKSISRRRDANCWHRNDFNTCNHDSNTKKQQGESQYRTLILFRKLDFCCWD